MLQSSKMHYKTVHKLSLLLTLLLIIITSCKGQGEFKHITHPLKEKQTELVSIPKVQVAQYVRNIFQDKNGDLWFGTNGLGVVNFNGKKLTYYSIDQGFQGYQITGIAEDSDRNLWFSTDQGIVKYEFDQTEEGNKKFINYTDTSYFQSQRFWSVYADSEGRIWVGAERGIYRLDGDKWSPFSLPYPKQVTGEFITAATTWSITEDSKGNMWFSTNGFGAFEYDGNSFVLYSEEDGLTDNHVDQILEDSKGNIWFGTRWRGLSKFDGNSFENFSQRDGVIGNDEVCVIYEDKKGDIWFSSEGFGVYKYDGENLTNYSEDQGLKVRAVQCIYEDRQGRFWVGGGGGLYRMEGNRFINVTASGPWN